MTLNVRCMSLRSVRCPGDTVHTRSKAPNDENNSVGSPQFSDHSALLISP